MERIEFPSGKVQWPDPSTGLACMIRKSPLGVWCGYVGVDETHPWFGRGYSDVDVEVEVHGGLTYAAACDGDEVDGICHVPGPGEPEPLWWFGFDCGHFDDVVPGEGIFPNPIAGATYKDQDYVTAEVTSLARQVAEVAG